MSAVDPGHTRDALRAGEALYGVELTCDEVTTSLRGLGIFTGDAVDGLRARGWLTAGTPHRLTPAGRRVRQGVEDRTDRLAATAYAPVGDAGIARMAELGRAVAGLVRDAGLDLEPHLARFGDPATAPPVTPTPEEAP